MSKLKLFGFTAEEQQSLQSRVRTERWETGQLEELKEPRPDDEVWVVCVTDAEEFLRAVSVGLPKAVLWVPKGKEPLPIAKWWEGFYAQLQEDSEDDCIFLEKISRCVRVLEWGELVDDISAGWFASLTGSPRLYEVDELPFSKEKGQHLKECVDCREEAYERLQHRAEMRWAMLCSSVDEIAEWLEGPGDKRLEGHISNCGLCLETVKRLAYLWEGAGLLTAEQVDARLVAVGIKRSLIDSPYPYVYVGLIQPQVVTAVSFAVLLTVVLCRHTPLSLAWRTAAEPAEEMEVFMEEVSSRLSADEPVTLLGKEQWLHLSVEGEALLLRAGRSPADRFEHFRVEFRKGEEIVVKVASEKGVARLMLEHFQTAQQGQADRLVIIV